MVGRGWGGYSGNLYDHGIFHGMFHSALIFWNKKTNLFAAGSSPIPILMWVQKWQGGGGSESMWKKRKKDSLDSVLLRVELVE